MGDDINSKVQQIAKMLGQDELPDNVKELIAVLASSLNKKEGAIDQATPVDAVSSDLPSEKEANIDKSNASVIKDRPGAANDPRINLLHAIKPFMNAKRQKKIGNCIQLLQLVGISKLMNGQEK